MNRKLPKRIVSILLVTMLIISLPITNLHRTEAAAKKVKVKFFACSGTFKADINKGKKLISAKIKKGKKMGMPPVVKRDNYVFTGWYTKKKGGKRYTTNTKIKKKTKLYAHWVKKYKINKKYEKILSIKPYPTFKDLEKDCGSLKFISEDKDYYPRKTYKSKNSNIYYIVYSYISVPDCSVSDITLKAKHLINIKKPTAYKTFLKKLGVKSYNKETRKKGLTLDFVTETVNLVFTDPEKEEWQYLHWEVKGIKNKKITPNTKITLGLLENWEKE